MSDLIDRQKIINRIDSLYRHAEEPYQLTEYEKGVNHGYDVATEIIDTEPSAERHGRWLRPRPVPQVWSLFMANCSECGKITYMGEYCMECGAKMERDDD